MEPQEPSPPSPPSSPSTPTAPSPSTARDEQHSSPRSSSVPPVASQQSPALGSGLPTPAADGGRHPKGKRKRTAAKDKAILEAAYNANPKPDKAARLDIVKRVSLNEKEVQIWFQNRRQNDRRKSRPLSPQEIAALRYGGMQILSSDPVPYNTSFSSEVSNSSPGQNMPLPEQRAISPLNSDPALSPSDKPEGEQEAQEVQQVPQEAGVWEVRERVGGQESATPAPNERTGAGAGQPLSRSFSGSVGYLSNRWNIASSFSTPSQPARDDSFRLGPFSSSCPSSIASTSILPPPGSQTSQFRLSTSLDGKAEVVPSMPSPPRPIAAPPTPDALQSLGSCTAPPRLTRGRSRDVHAWEFCCDAENREDALTVQAKHESSGSAVAAISLLRSASLTGGSPLQQSSSAKRNASMTRAPPRAGMAKKPKLGRAMSSVARMQGTLGLGQKHNMQRDRGAPPDKLKVSTLVSLSGNDSDKENWSPDEDGNPRATSSHRATPSNSGTPGRRPLPSGPSRLDRKHPRRTADHGLQEARSPALPSSRANTAPTRGFQSRRSKRAESPLEIYEDSENNSPASRPALDDEVERFMRGEVSPSKKGDVDAVAGLLSLSQGNWR
ncbi:Homeobox protein YOX1 [Madurella mycetomatis]|uniref:Homeobox protein YOX1 n=1 Tax=Madurella mycetomatis TaxID=100816 RepID=A0A175W985_9PEZI|nr:Homeobox protein YOX1 [Madurella mycetomatis]